jgi:hypothetical protein
MSSLDSLDLEEVAELVSYPRGYGYVLHFSDPAFAAFFKAEFRVNINEPRFQDIGPSKGKRLRSFLMQAKDGTALRALDALWKHRVALLRRNRDDDPMAEAEARYEALRAKLGAQPAKTQPGANGVPAADKPVLDPAVTAELKAELIRITGLEPHARGYALESYLQRLFAAHGLKPREPFRNRGEQIDGSFVVDGAVYLLEAKWESAQTGAAVLRAFEGKIGDKAPWTRGLFLSQSGFTEDGLVAFGRGKRTVCMDGLDLYEMLNMGIRFDELLERKVRRAAETGLPFIRVRDLF